MFRSDQGFGVSPSMLVADMPTRLCCADWCTHGQGTYAKDVFGGLWCPPASDALDDGIKAVPFIDSRVGRRAFHTTDVMVTIAAQEICDQSACRNRFFKKFGKHTTTCQDLVQDAYGQHVQLSEVRFFVCACALVSWGSGNGQCRSIFVYVLFGEQHYHRKLSRYIDSSGESTDPIPLGTHTHTHTPTLRRSRS